MAKRKAVAFPLSVEPELISGALCASQSGAADHSDSPLQVHALPVALHTFFNSDDFHTEEDVYDTARKLPGADAACKKALSSLDASAEILRDAVFTELLHRGGIQFPPLSQCTLEKKNNKKTKVPCSPATDQLNPHSSGMAGTSSRTFVYKESSLSGLLRASSAFFIPNVETQITSMDRLMNGLLVTTTSLPDMVPFQVTDNNLHMIRMAEFKNKSKFTKNSASTQCFAYLYALLYWVRVVHGIPLKSVYGFGFCGGSCGDNNKTYSIGLFRLTAPTHLGQTCRAEECWKIFGTNSDLGVKLLHLHLTKGKLWDMATAQQSRIALELRKPAIFGAPQAYWQDNDQDISLVRNGTRAIVFKVNYDGLLKIIANIVEGSQDSDLTGYDDVVQSQVPVPADRQQKNYYLKIRTRDTSYHFDKNKFSDLYGRANTALAKRKSPGFCRDFFRTYIADPFSDDDCLIVVMADRGTRIEDKLGSPEEVRSLVNPLKCYMGEMVQFMFHGDFLPHNFLKDASGSLAVIDHDEGGIGEVGRRAVDCANASWHSIIRYPNALRFNRKEYTQIQFAAGLLQLVATEVAISDLKGLVDAAKSLGFFLKTYELEMKKRPPMPKGAIEAEAVELIAEVNLQVAQFLDNSRYYRERGRGGILRGAPVY